jgi:hypothetical protein
VPVFLTSSDVFSLLLNKQLEIFFPAATPVFTNCMHHLVCPCQCLLYFSIVLMYYHLTSSGLLKKCTSLFKLNGNIIIQYSA